MLVLGWWKILYIIVCHILYSDEIKQNLDTQFTQQTMYPRNNIFFLLTSVDKQQLVEIHRLAFNNDRSKPTAVFILPSGITKNIYTYIKLNTFIFIKNKIKYNKIKSSVHSNWVIRLQNRHFFYTITFSYHVKYK